MDSGFGLFIWFDWHSFSLGCALTLRVRRTQQSGTGFRIVVLQDTSVESIYDDDEAVGPSG